MGYISMNHWFIWVPLDRIYEDSRVDSMIPILDHLLFCYCHYHAVILWLNLRICERDMREFLNLYHVKLVASTCGNLFLKRRASSKYPKIKTFRKISASIQYSTTALVRENC